MMPSLTKGKTKAKRASSKQSRKSSQTIQSGIDESTHAPISIRGFDIILIYIKPLHLIMKGFFF
jgi:hypothetical protein